ncbi:MAG TPA: hypothetical protein VMT00_00405 [Thermoanaerobaculia bacterium]|nr:hypothetical protein [Thermoanaerobaculia bacterium]
MRSALISIAALLATAVIGCQTTDIRSAESAANILEVLISGIEIHPYQTMTEPSGTITVAVTNLTHEEITVSHVSVTPTEDPYYRFEAGFHRDPKTIQPGDDGLFEITLRGMTRAGVPRQERSSIVRLRIIVGLSTGENYAYHFETFVVERRG